MASYPSLSSAMQKALEAARAGQVLNNSAFIVKRHSLWHRYTLTGLTAGSTINLFNVAETAGTTNMPQPGALPVEEAMLIDTIRVGIDPGYQVDGTAEADGEPAATDLDPFTAAADFNAIMRFSEFELFIAGRRLVHEIGLHQFPEGGGVVASAAVENTNSTVLNSIALCSNGVAHQQNRWVAAPALELPGQKQLAVKITPRITRTLKDTYTLTTRLQGWHISPANN